MLKQLLKPARHHQLLYLLNGVMQEALREMALLDLSFIQKSLQNDGCSASPPFLSGI